MPDDATVPSFGSPELRLPDELRGPLLRHLDDLRARYRGLDWAADTGAFVAGKLFGRVKLAPQISPGKTWEGVIGGLLTVAVLAVAGAYLFDARVSVLVPFCLAVACASIVGDLTVSMFKRNAGLKDSGNLFPGHGGVLDRVDSVTAAVPLFVFALTWLELFDHQ